MRSILSPSAKRPRYKEQDFLEGGFRLGSLLQTPANSVLAAVKARDVIAAMTVHLAVPGT